METTQQEQTQQNPLTQTPEESKVLDVVVRELQDAKKRLAALENKTVLEQLQLPEEDLKALGVVQDARRIRKGRGARPLLESEIKEAMEHADNATACAKYLGVGYNCYKKWAKQYGLFKTNPWGKGDRKYYWAPDKGKYPLNQILEGKFPNYPIYRLKDLLIRSGIKKPECEVCNWDERRIDGKMPLLLNFKDGNERNHKLENLQILCYNHTFVMGKGFIRRGKIEINFSDPDRMQGSSRKIEARF